MKGFVHVVEILLIVILVFFVFAQFATIPKISDDWSTTKLGLIGSDALQTLEAKGVDWFNRTELENEFNKTVPENVMYSIGLKNVVKPEIKIICLCDNQEFDIIEDILYGGFEINGVQVNFDLQQAEDADEIFSLDYDVALIYGFEDLTQNTYALRNFLNYEKGVIEICDIEDIDSVQSGIFGLNFSNKMAGTGNSTFTEEADNVDSEVSRIYKYFLHLPSDIPNQGIRYKAERGSVSAWEFEGNLRDSVNGNQGTAYGGLDCAGDEGKVGDGCYFDGDDAVEVNDDASLDITDQITLEAWVKTTSSSGSSNLGIVGKYQASPEERSYALFHQANTDKFYFRLCNSTDGSCNTNTRFLTSTSVINDGEWHHIAGVYNGTNMAVYFDGVMENITDYSAGIYSGSAKLTIGSVSVSGSPFAFFNGNIDEVAVYNRALTANEIYYHFYIGNRTQGTFEPGTEIPGLLSPGENITQLENDNKKLLLKQKGTGVASSVINYNIQGIGRGRTAWISNSTETGSEEFRTLLKSVLSWAAGDDYKIIDSGMTGQVSSYIYKVLTKDMFQSVKITIELGYLF